MPSPRLDPEQSVTYEVGVKTRTETLASELAVFYTDLDDAIVRVPTGATSAGATS